MRNLLLQSGKISVTIEEELDFTRHYLELEKMRYNIPFEYTITGEKNFLNWEVPKMLIHTFCENAIKHGLKHLKKKGQLKINFVKEDKHLKIFITDNGIGREKAKEYSLMSTGKGLEIVNQNLKLYKQLKNVAIQYDITDIYKTKKQPSGTKVEITIPDNSKPSRFRKP